jgi:hypothetical protein
MKKFPLKAVVFTSILLISLAFEAQLSVKALDILNDINIWSTNPLNNTTYYSNKITLNVTLSAYETDSSINVARKAWYSLDSQERLPLQLLDKGITTNNGNALPHSIVLGAADLPSLSNGIHDVTIYGEFVFPTKTKRGSCTITFTIDTAPIVILDLVENRIYNTSDIPLSFNVDGEYSWLGYTLDNLAIVTIDGNATLTGLSDGYHSLVVYANDTSGNIGKSETLSFIVAKEVETEPFLTTLLVAISAISAVIVIASITIYFRRRNTRDKNLH